MKVRQLDAAEDLDVEPRPLPGTETTLAELAAVQGYDDAISTIIRRHVPPETAERLGRLISARKMYLVAGTVQVVVRHLPAFAPTIRALADHATRNGMAPRCCGLLERGAEDPGP